MEQDGKLTPGQFEGLVFSGGGTRCFWQGGFLEAVHEPLGLRPARIAAVSGGALSACAWIGGRAKALLDIMGDAFADQDSNLGEAPGQDSHRPTPHQSLYRDVVEETLNADAVRRVADGPKLEITLARPPRHLPLRAGAMLALVLYEIDRKARSSPHTALPVMIGSKALRVDARAAAREGKLHDLVCAAAVIPPVFALPCWQGERVMDAGTCDNAPMPEPEQGGTLILLTRRYRNTPDRPDRLYVAPSDETPADKIDFTDKEKIEKTWRLGNRDGKEFLQRHGLRAEGAAQRARDRMAEARGDC